jgi:hypothetical protein
VVRIAGRRFETSGTRHLSIEVGRANVRTLILILICTAFVVGGVMDARAGKKSPRYVFWSGVLAFGLGVVTCWLLVYVIGIFDNWKYSLR